MGKKLVIIGAGPAGVTVAETVRKYDRDREIIVLSAEPYPPYSPPAMVDHFLTGSESHLWRGVNWPTQIGVDYRSGVTVTAIEPDSHRLQLDNESTLDYDYLVIATGSRLYAPVQGSDLPGIYNFKSLSAAESLIQRIRIGEARSALIVGAGFIGVEIALLLSELGVKVTLIEMLDQVMPSMLDPLTAEFALTVMQQRGIELQLGTKAAAFLGEIQATSVQLESGDILKADILIAATGVRPNLELLESSNIQHQWGITVDDHLRTSAVDIYAAGDAIEVPDRLTGELYVHAIFPNATEQGLVVGLNLAGYDVAYQGGQRMNSLKHLGLPIMAVGLKEGNQVLSSRINGGLRTLYLEEDRLVGFQLVGDVRPAGALRTLMDRRENVSRIKDHLLEPTFGQGALVWSAINI